MNREIKFRAWDEQAKTMHHNFQCIKSGDLNEGGSDWIIPLEPITNEDWIERLVDHCKAAPHFRDQFKLMQYTGLQDAGGIDVYEGDLLRIPPKDQYEETTFNCFEVFYHDNECIGGQNIGFCMNRMHPQGNSAGGMGYKFTPESIKKHGFVVIGNIYETPELLRK